MADSGKGFHAQQGWYFARYGDGAVRVWYFDPEFPEQERIVLLDANTWASIVAHVSALGENTERFNAALAFHNASLAEPETCPTCGSDDPDVIVHDMLRADVGPAIPGFCPDPFHAVTHEKTPKEGRE